MLTEGFGVFVIVHIAVADRNEGETLLVIIAFAVVRDVPAERIVTDLIILVALFFPFLRCKAQERRKGEAVFTQHRLKFFDDSIDF